MIPEKLLEILKSDGIAAIATLGKDGPHLVNTWNSYIKVWANGRLLIPAGYMHRTEANISHNNKLLMTLNSRKVTGNHGPGAGFLIKGTGAFLTSGPEYDSLKAKFNWIRAAFVVTIDSADQTW